MNKAIKEVGQLFLTGKIDRNDYILKIMKARTNYLTSGPKAKQKCRDYLISTGIYNEDGTLHENYGGEAETN